MELQERIGPGRAQDGHRGVERPAGVVGRRGAVEERDHVVVDLDLAVGDRRPHLRAGGRLELRADRALEVLVHLDRVRRGGLPDHDVVGAGQVGRRTAGAHRLAAGVLVARDREHHAADDRDGHHHGTDDQPVAGPLLALLLPHQRLGALRLRLLTSFVRHRRAFRTGEQQVVEGELRARPDDQPDRAEQQADVARDVDRVLALRVGGNAAVAEAAAVDLQAACPRRRDADDEREEEQAAHDAHGPGEQAEDQQGADHDLDRGQCVTDGGHDRLGEDLVGADGPDVARRVGELGQAGQQLDRTHDQARQEADPLLHDAPPYGVALNRR